MNQRINTRNYGIDLLRMISMFFVLLLHILRHGGILANSGFLTAQYHTAWILEITAFCAVNCYGLISGYVMADRKFKYHKILTLWTQVVFYTILITLVFWIFVPESVGIKRWIFAVFPATSNQYWYFTTYFGMFFLIPFLNHLINTLSKKQLTILLFTCFILFSVIPTFSMRDLFRLNDGYSLIWLSILYLAGGYLKKYQIVESVKKRWLGITWIACIIITWASKAFIAFFSNQIFGSPKYDDLLIHYISPTIICIAVVMVLLFAKINFKNRMVIKLISFASPLAFSVYIIHSQPLIWEYYFKNRFMAFGTFAVPMMILAIIGTALGIYLICSLIDWIRIKLFQWLHISSFCEKACNKVKEKGIAFLQQRSFTK